MVDHVVARQGIERNAGVRRQIDLQGFLFNHGGAVTRRVAGGHADANLRVGQYVRRINLKLIAQLAVCQRHYLSAGLLTVDRHGDRVADLRIAADGAADLGGVMQRLGVVDHFVADQGIHLHRQLWRRDIQKRRSAGGGRLPPHIGGGDINMQRTFRKATDVQRRAPLAANHRNIVNGNLPAVAIDKQQIDGFLVTGAAQYGLRLSGDIDSRQGVEGGFRRQLCRGGAQHTIRAIGIRVLNIDKLFMGLGQFEVDSFARQFQQQPTVSVHTIFNGIQR